jgi:hypothetical protein
MLGLLKSRKFQMGIIGVIVEVIIAAVPELEGSRVALMAAVFALFGALIGAHTLTDVAAIKAGK